MTKLIKQRPIPPISDSLMVILLLSIAIIL